MMCFNTMKKLVIYLCVLLALGVQTSWAANSVDSMLFGPAPKITAKKNNPLIPKINKTETGSKKTITPKVQTNSNQPTKSKSVPAKKEEKSLTEKIKQAEKQIDDKIEEKTDSFLKDTWVEKLSTSISSKDSSADDIEIGSIDGSLDSLTHQDRSNTRSNAAVFNISGVMLRMSLAQAESALLKRGFKMVSQKFEIPNFIKWRYEEKCRNSGVIGYERLNNCVVKAAKEKNYQFVQNCKFIKTDSKEEIDIWLTSNFTNNKIYKIAYETGITNINHGSGQKIKYLRDIKTYEFWRRINQKYGAPDNKTEVTWGMGGNKPYMKAATGKLLLEDPMLRELDYTRMSREDAKFINTDLYNF